MMLSDELALSYYKPVADINAGHSVQLVQHTETKKFFVRKRLSMYHLEVYRSLQAAPVRNVPRIALLVEDNAELIVIEEYIHGDTLEELVAQNGLLPEGLAVNYALQLCQIVSELHHRTPPIIHRDIKPSNVMVSPDGVIKLLDMNAAKYETPNQPRDTTLLGTAGFAAPEQYGFAPSGVQSDLFAIGVLLNVLITGRMPTEAAVKGRLGHIVHKCTELDPANRYASVDELMHELKGVQSDASEREDAPYTRTWRRYLPPGFRSGSIPHMLFATVGYVLLFAVALCMEVEAATPLALAMNRVTVILIGLAVIFFSADYCGVQAHMPLTRSRNPLLRWLGIVLYDILIAFALLMILVLIEPTA
ncbi:MAG: serine/threonine protein kinase [Clostridiales bacterium]|nr:serine/threonine protein kinase [Clostridiales bacterium]